MSSFEQLGAFYLGHLEGAEEPTPLLYDAKDLTTHAVVVGMTGSGKTGLGITLIEEAIIDGVPVLAIDPKGDLGNLLLTFPSLRAQDFRPWIDESDATRHGRSADEHAQWTADLWRRGLKETGQRPARIRAFAEAAERTIYTPGSRDGRPISVLRSLAPPPAEVMSDDQALRDRIGTAVSGLLGLVGVTADPIRSREHVLLATLLMRAWSAGQGLDLPTLIQQVQKPPVERVGVLDLESFYPASERFDLVMRLNNLLASPGFSVWSEGDPLDVASLLHTEDGQPRLSIMSVSHLSDAERMFFVTMLLNDLVSWVRSQPGSSSLRAVLYMDEIFGYVPPTANPPSKQPLLTLLKQARAHGLGVVLATQNPVDLDYRGLSNAGTWFIGRLQTEQDKARLLDGLESASAAGLGRAETERIISGLDSRVFLMNNTHDDAPAMFRTRWALSYLRGPLTGDQIARLGSAAASPTPARRPAPPATPAREVPRPSVPADVEERFLAVTHPAIGDERLVYRPAIGTTATLHYANARAGVDHWEDIGLLAPLSRGVKNPWDGVAEVAPGALTFVADPVDGASYSPLPAAAGRAKQYGQWQKRLASHLYRNRPLELWRCRKPKLLSQVDEPRRDFMSRLQQALHEQRDLEVEKLRARYAPKLARLQERIRTAERKVDAEQSQYRQQKTQTAISLGATVVGALFGRKLAGLGTLGRATTAMRGAGRATREREDVRRATERVESLTSQLRELERKFQEDLDKRRTSVDPSELDIRELRVACRKTDLTIQPLMLVWAPWLVGPDGIARPAYDEPSPA